MIRTLFSKLSKPKKAEDPNEILGVTLGWNMKPALLFGDRKILGFGADRILYPQYFKNGDWPTDPETGEKLKIFMGL